MTKNSDDPLNRETSVSAELTETGVKAKTNSRAIAALDRLVGNIADVWNSKLERSIDKGRAVSDAETAIIRSAAEAVAKRIGTDPDLAMRALESHLESTTRKQANKEAVALETIEQLKLAPPPSNEEQSDAGTVSEEFIAGFEPFAERAATDALRAKWAKVLSSEIRAPGTFTQKALRITDELDGSVAQLFEKLCKSRLGNCVPKAIAQKLEFIERQALVNADLLTDPSVAGHIRYFAEMRDDAGNELYFAGFGHTAVAIGKSTSAQMLTSADLGMNDGKLTLPVYILTEAGAALASILEDNELEAVGRLAETLAKKMPGVEVREFAEVADRRFKLVRVHQA